MINPLLQISHLHVDFAQSSGIKPAILDVSLEIAPGEILGVVGESGSGKSVMAMSVLGLHPPGAIVKGSVHFDGHELLGLNEREMKALRGNQISMIFQDPLTALNPVLSIGRQLSLVIRAHNPNIRGKAVEKRILELLELVHIPHPGGQMHRYPHQYSGGMRQRIMIAMAIANQPRLLIADEPTTALDVTIQAQVLKVLKRARAETGAAVILITHDLGVVAETCDRVAVMYAGRIVELGDIYQIFESPRHPYTAALLESLPRIENVRDRMFSIQGEAITPGEEPVGCPFNPRCRVAGSHPLCYSERPQLREIKSSHFAACHRADRLVTLEELASPTSKTGPARKMEVT